MAEAYDSVVQIDPDHVDNGNVTRTVLVDSGSSTQSFCQRSWKLLLIFLVLAVICIVGLVIYINVKSPTDCKKSDINIPNNSSRWDDQEKQYNRTYIYKTSAEIMEVPVKNFDNFGSMYRWISWISHHSKNSTEESETIPYTNNPNNSRTWDAYDKLKTVQVVPIHKKNTTLLKDTTTLSTYQELTPPDEQYKGTCIYNTPTEFLKKLEQDPFGDLCRRDSPICQERLSTHACKSCGDENNKLPSFCFCDKKGHCNHMDGEMAFDSQRNSDCSDCLGSFRLSPFNASGTCTCQKQKVSLQCDCHEGFSGFMCSSIVLRYCKSKDNIESEIPHCKDSNEESCHLNQDGKHYLCVAFDDSNRKQRRSAASCVIIVTP